jgi:hypothetical protein
MVTDNALDEVLSWGIKIDLVLAEIAGIESVRQKLEGQGPLTILPYQPTDNAVRTGLYHLINSKQNAVNIVMRATDDGFEVFQKLIDKLNIVVLSRDMRWSSISNEFRKWVPAKTKFLTHCDPGTQMTFRNLKMLEQGLLEAEREGHVRIIADRPFWIGEFFD